MKKRKITAIVLIFALVIASAFCLCACDKQDDSDGDVIRNLYIYSVELQKKDDTQNATDATDDNVALVYVTFSQTSRKIEGATALWHSEKSKDTEFYYLTKTSITLNPNAIFCAVKESVPQEELTDGEVVYNRLKVVLRYDTIYKSIKSDGEITRTQRTYTHKFALDESLENDVFTLEMRTPNSANWYAVLVACALVVALVAIIVTCAVKGAKCQKTKTKE